MMADPFVLLPANLARLADLPPDSSHRFALNGIHVVAGDGSYVVCATDGRRLAVVRGKAGHDPLDFPTVPELIEGDAAESALIPTREWKEAFKSLPKGSAVKDQPILAHVALHLGGEESVLATTDGEEATVLRARNVGGRYPDYGAVMPKDEPAGSAVVDCRLLLSVLRVAEEVARDEDGVARITLEFRTPQRPLVIRSGNATQEFVGLVMPLDPPPVKSRPDNV